MGGRRELGPHLGVIQGAAPAGAEMESRDGVAGEGGTVEGTVEGVERAGGVAGEVGAGGEGGWVEARVAGQVGTGEGEKCEDEATLTGVGAAGMKGGSLGAVPLVAAIANASLTKPRRRSETEPEPARPERAASGVDEAKFARSGMGPMKDSASRISSAKDPTLNTGSTSGTESDGDQRRVGPMTDGLTKAE